jgi:3D-(3,5/4)-trihydroxycyclohexane-1,2-dione acylhydrolase (decyclizing)
VVRAPSIAEFREALAGARDADGTVAVYVEVDRDEGVPDYESWWDVPVAEVSRMETVNAAREEYEQGRRAQRAYVEPPP